MGGYLTNLKSSRDIHKDGKAGQMGALAINCCRVLISVNVSGCNSGRHPTTITNPSKIGLSQIYVCNL